MPTIEDVKRKREPELLAIRGVVGVKIIDGDFGEPVIAVYITDPAAQQHVPKLLDGFPVQVQASSEFDATGPR